MTTIHRATSKRKNRLLALVAVVVGSAATRVASSSATAAVGSKGQMAKATQRIDRMCAVRFHTTSKRRACRNAVLSTTPRRTKAVLPGFVQYAYMCHRGTLPVWTGVALTSTTFPQHMGATGHTRDFVIYPQLPEGLQPGTTAFNAAVNTACTAAAVSAFQPFPNGAPAAIRPVAPTFNEACGTAADVYGVPAPTIGVPATGVPQTIGVVYFVNGSPLPVDPNDYLGTGTVTIEARTYGVFRFVAGATTRWTFTFSATPCPRPVTPLAPTISALCGPNDDVVNVPTVEGVTYTTSVWRNNSLTVTATANEGFVIPAGVRSTWTFTDAAVPCPIPVTPTAPTVAPRCGPANDEVTLPQITGLTYLITDWADNVRVATAIAQQGYVITPGSPVSWRITDGAVPCPIVEPPPPPAALSIGKTVRAIGPANRPVRFRILVRNTGPVTAKNVTITDRVPSGLALTAIPTDAVLVKGVVTWQIGDLEPGSFVYVSATMRLTSNRTVRRCNGATAGADNTTSDVSASACTRFTRVAGRARGGVTG